MKPRIETLVFRANVSPAVGMGHSMRALALARAIGETCKIGGCLLVARDDDGMAATIDPVEAEGWNVEILDRDCTDEDDAHRTAAIASNAGAALVVTDLCSRDFIDRPGRLASYHVTLRARLDCPVLSIEDCRMTAYTSDTAVVPYDCGDPDPALRARSGCQVYAGPEYYVCDPRLVRHRKSRTIRAEANRVLVAIGGSDSRGVAVGVAKALTATEDWSPEVRIVAGRGMSPGRRRELEQICAASEQLETVDFIEDFGAELAHSDLIVLGEGLVRFEAAITGTPSVTISQFEHDSDVLRRFYAVGTTDYLGPAGSLTASKIAAGIRSLAKDAVRRRQQSETGMRLYDGKGSARIAAIATQLAMRQEVLP